MTVSEQPLTESMFYILLALRHPLHGYGITQEVIEMTGGRVRLGAGTLYGAIKTLCRNGWIEPVGGTQGARGKKEYVITEEGKEVFHTEVERLKELLKNAERMNENAEIPADVR